MPKVERFEDLNCWKEARILVNMVYKVAEKGKLKNDFDTKSQLKRAALSVMNNIAEGFGRYHQKEFTRFLDFSQSSCSEVKSMLYVLDDIDYLDKEELKIFHEQTDKTRNMILALIKYLNKK